jgi:hypothetical protein
MTELSDMAVAKLLAIRERGSLPDVYDGVEDWLYDFWSDLNWTVEDRDDDIRDLRSHPCYHKIASFFRSRYGFDFTAELEAGLMENQRW